MSHYLILPDLLTTSSISNLSDPKNHLELLLKEPFPGSVSDFDEARFAGVVGGTAGKQRLQHVPRMRLGSGKFRKHGIVLSCQ